jgi:hypothetical protein
MNASFLEVAPTSFEADRGSVPFVAASDASLPRSLGLAVLIAVAAALITVVVAFSILAMPFFALARATEPGHGLARPFIRNGLFHIALPAGALVGVVTGAAVGRWYRKGGRLPDAPEYWADRR